jgi:uncharacterized NAD(P)/FAD-binding protein YdhS
VTPPIPFDVAIVGGGASGALLAIQLLRMAPPSWRRLLLVDRSGDFARGIAYRTEEESHVLNVSAGRMSALADDDGHFLAWLQRKVRGAKTDTYAPRRVYGDYLSELLSRTERAFPSVRLERRHAEVLGLDETQAGLRLRFASGPDALARQAVLALGNPLPAPLPATPAARARVWQSPWPPEGKWPPRRATVLLVGAGLTAIDWIVALAARGHQGRLHLLSRHGLLPNAHRTASTTPLDLSRVPRGRLRPLLRAVREAAAQDSGDWRAAVDGLRPLAQDIWVRLGDAERRRFARHVRTHWEVLRHRLAPSVAERAESLRASDQLRVHAGRLLGIAKRGARLEARFRPRGETRPARLAVDLVINCTGPVGHTAQPDTLVAGLLQTGHARPGPLGLGLASSASGALLNAQGEASGTVWTLGPVRRGDHWESTAVPDIRQQASALAEQLVRSV